jgi:holo-[acyl-carrier protein] synthase
MIYGIGIDLVEIERLVKIIDRWGLKFLQRIFSTAEINYCSRHAQAAMHYGARFAAKESFLKALGIGLGMGVRFQDIEVVHNSNGKPGLIFLGEAKKKDRRKKHSPDTFKFDTHKNICKRYCCLGKKWIKY